MPDIHRKGALSRREFLAGAAAGTLAFTGNVGLAFGTARPARGWSTSRASSRRWSSAMGTLSCRSAGS